MLSSSEFYLINAAGSERFKDATVLVAGATGGVGRQVVQRLAREGATVKALVRDFAKGVSPIALQCCGASQVLDLGCAGHILHTALPRSGSAPVTASSAWVTGSNRGPHCCLAHEMHLQLTGVHSAETGRRAVRKAQLILQLPSKHGLAPHCHKQPVPIVCS